MQEGGGGAAGGERLACELESGGQVAGAHQHGAQRNNVRGTGQAVVGVTQLEPAATHLDFIGQLATLGHDLRGTDGQVGDAAGQAHGVELHFHAGLQELRRVQREHQVFGEVAGEVVAIGAKEQRALRVVVARHRGHAVVALGNEDQRVALASLQQYRWHGNGSLGGVLLEVGAGHRHAGDRLLQVGLAAVGFSDSHYHVAVRSDLRELQAHFGEPHGIGHQHGLPNQGAVVAGGHRVQLVVGFGAAGVVAVVGGPAVVVAVVVPVPAVVPAAVIVPVVAVVVVPHRCGVLAHDLGLHLVLAYRNIAAVARGLDAGH